MVAAIVVIVAGAFIWVVSRHQKAKKLLKKTGLPGEDLSEHGDIFHVKFGGR